MLRVVRTVILSFRTIQVLSELELRIFSGFFAIRDLSTVM